MSDELTAGSWNLAPHTAAKLQVLGAYLRAWFPILSRGRNFNRIIYIDGFAGPGRYGQGEDGSPIVALKAALGSLMNPIQTPCEFHFVEHKRRAVNALRANIDHLRRQWPIPTSIEIFIHERMTFEEAYDRHIRSRLQQNPAAPAFVLVDPFGWAGLPMSIITELMRRSSTEVLVNFMFEEINRFLNHPQQVANFDALFAGSAWRDGDTMSGPARKAFIHDLYRDQLRTVAGARYVRSFEMRNQRNLTDYYLYFASNNRLGLSKMKEAMWKVDPGGGFTFSDATNLAQTVLFQPKPDWRALRRLIENRFAGRRATVSQIDDFVLEDTPFHSGHFKRVLATMEKERALIAIAAPPRRRRETFPDASLVLEFAATPNTLLGKRLSDPG